MTFASRPSAPVSPGVARLEFMSRRNAEFRAFVEGKGVPDPHGPVLPGALPGPFTPTLFEAVHSGEIEQMAWRALLLHFGDTVEMRPLSQGGQVLGRQPGVSYKVQDGRHHGRVVGFWEEGAARPVFQLRASSLEPETARRIIRAVQLLGGDFNLRPLHVRGRASHYTVGWAKDARLYRPERCATFRRNAEGLYCVYTRLLTAAELAVVLESAAPAVRKYQTLRRLQFERAAELRRKREEEMRQRP